MEQAVDHLVLVLTGPVPAQPNLQSLGLRAHRDHVSCLCVICKKKIKVQLHDSCRCSLQVGTLVDAVDNMRAMSRNIITTHFEMSESSRSTGRTEYLPVLWEHDFVSDAALRELRQ